MRAAAMPQPHTKANRDSLRNRQGLTPSLSPNRRSRVTRVLHLQYREIPTGEPHVHPMSHPANAARMKPGLRLDAARWQSPNITIAVRCGIALATVIAIGTVGFRLIEADWDLWESLYFTLITITTVGYGDQGISPAGRKFALLVLLFGIGIATYSFSNLIQLAVHYQLAWKTKMQRQISKLENHIVVCGFGRMGKTVCDRLRADNVPFVVVEQGDQAYQEAVDLGMLAIQGCATEDDVLKRAGVPDARGIVCVVNSDAENVFITLSARHLNEHAFIACRADSDGAAEKVQRAGASLVVSPHYSAGLDVATAIVRPHLAEFLRNAQHNLGDFELSEVHIDPASSLIGQTIADFGANEEQLVFVAIKRAEGDTLVRPGGGAFFQAGDVVIAAGDPEALARMHEVGRAMKTNRPTSDRPESADTRLAIEC
jgi:voltage-gated potassium channel